MCLILFKPVNERGWQENDVFDADYIATRLDNIRASGRNCEFHRELEYDALHFHSFSKSLWEKWFCWLSDWRTGGFGVYAWKGARPTALLRYRYCCLWKDIKGFLRSSVESLCVNTFDYPRYFFHLWLPLSFHFLSTLIIRIAVYNLHKRQRYNIYFLSAQISKNQVFNFLSSHYIIWSHDDSLRYIPIIKVSIRNLHLSSPIYTYSSIKRSALRKMLNFINL